MAAGRAGELISGRTAQQAIVQRSYRLVADSFHLLAPDLPGLGLSALPARQEEG